MATDIFPPNDAVDHEAGADCICGPTVMGTWDCGPGHVDRLLDIIWCHHGLTPTDSIVIDVGPDDAAS